LAQNNTNKGSDDQKIRTLFLLAQVRMHIYHAFYDNKLFKNAKKDDIFMTGK